MNPQAEVLRAFLARRFRNRMIAMGIGLVVFLVGATISQIQNNQEMTIYHEHETETQTAITNRITTRYGTLPIDLCNAIGLAAGSGTLNRSAKLLAIRVRDSSIYDPYDNVLLNHPDSILNLDGVVCIHENRDTIYRSDPYKSASDPNAPVTHYCHHHRVDFDVTIITAHSKQIVAEESFMGSEVDSRLNCPVTNDLDMDWSSFSDPPLPSTIADWVTGIIAGDIKPNTPSANV